MTRQVTGAARVGVLGFSEGSWIAARTAAAPEAPDFLILASAPIVTPLEQSAWIVDRQMGALPEPVRRVPAASSPPAGQSWTTSTRTHGHTSRPVTSQYSQSGGRRTSQGAGHDSGPAADRERVARSDRADPPGRRHRLEDRSGWADHVADWLRAKPPVTDQFRGASPADGHGVPGLPRWTGPLTFLSLFGATLAAVAAATNVGRPSRQEQPVSGPDLISTGVVLLVVITIAWGGTFLLRVVSGAVGTNELQQIYFRAGHAHAGVLVILGLVVRLLLVDVPLPGWLAQLPDLVLYAAVLMPAGFFLSVIGRNPTRPNRLRYLIYLGAGALAVGLASAGIGLIMAGVRTA